MNLSATFNNTARATGRLTAKLAKRTASGLRRAADRLDAPAPRPVLRTLTPEPIKMPISMRIFFGIVFSTTTLFVIAVMLGVITLLV